MGGQGIHFSVIMSSFGAFAIVQTFLTTWTLNELCLPACGRDRYLMVLLAIFSFAGQILLTMALQREQAGPVAIARSADIVFAFIWQVRRFFGRANCLLLVSIISCQQNGGEKRKNTLKEPFDIQNTPHGLMAIGFYSSF